MNEVRSSADLAIVNECWLRRWTPSRAARAILSFQPVLERIQYLYFIIFWKKEWKLNRNIGSSKLNSPLSFFLFSLLSSFPFPFSFSLFFFCIRAPPAPKICLPESYLNTWSRFLYILQERWSRIFTVFDNGQSNIVSRRPRRLAYGRRIRWLQWTVIEKINKEGHNAAFNPVTIHCAKHGMENRRFELGPPGESKLPLSNRKYKDF